VERFVERACRFYEQGADALRIGEYVGRWWKWVRAGIDSALTLEWEGGVSHGLIQFHELLTTPERVCQEFSRLDELNREMARNVASIETALGLNPESEKAPG
jgi:hypothetical protein